MTTGKTRKEKNMPFYKKESKIFKKINLIKIRRKFKEVNKLEIL